MKKPFIVITSINNPTEAIKKFAHCSGYHVVVVGDTKTPVNWYLKNVDFLSIADGRTKKYGINKVLPFNHYSRKMLGYIFAIESGATEIIDTDDDNIPKNDWSFPLFNSNNNKLAEDMGFINIYQYYTTQKIWPRGLPLKLINSVFNYSASINRSITNVGIWQGLADEEPDVDAIYRLTDNQLCIFEDKDPIVLGKGTISPFNTQNTSIRKELFPLLYLPTYVTFRFTDILRGLVAQPIMWLYGYELGFAKASVVQRRNFHDFFQDFILEIPMYENVEKVIEITSNSLATNQSLENNLYNAYKGLLKVNIVKDEEIITLEEWLKDIQKLKI